MTFDSLRLSKLPSYGKLFVGCVTTLMILVVLWAAWIYTVEKGEIDESELPGYLSEEQKSAIRESDSPFVVSKSEESHSENENHERLSHNLGLAHVHVNGQTLLFFALGVLFLFTSASATLKRNLIILFGLSIVLHVIGLTGQGFYSFFDDILAISGVVMLIVMLYMAFMIFVDLGRTRRDKAS